jgi:hypothetical protein
VHIRQSIEHNFSHFNLDLFPFLSEKVFALSSPQADQKAQIEHEAAHQDTPVGADDGQGEGRVPAQVGQDAETRISCKLNQEESPE